MKFIYQLSFRLMAVILLLQACSPDPFRDANVTIKGSMPLLAGKQLVLNEIEVFAFRPVDTVRIDRNGDFAIGLKIEETGIFVLKESNQNTINLILSPGDHIILKAEESQLKGNYEVSGSEECKILQEFESVYEEKRSLVDQMSESTRKTGGQTAQQAPPAVKKLFDGLFQEHKAYVTRKVTEAPGNISNLVMINRRFGQKRVFNEFDDFELFALIDSALMAQDPENKHVKDHHFKVEDTRVKKDALEKARQRLAPGKPAPDFTLPDVRGNDVSLKDLRGMYVLLYFWNSVDASSRSASSQLIRLDREYKSKGLRLVGVSLDSYADMWKAAIKADKLSWTHVSDLRGQHSPTVFLYQVNNKLPYYYLIGRDQTILGSSDDIDEIRNTIEKVMKK